MMIQILEISPVKRERSRKGDQHSFADPSLSMPKWWGSSRPANLAEYRSLDYPTVGLVAPSSVQAIDVLDNRMNSRRFALTASLNTRTSSVTTSISATPPLIMRDLNPSIRIVHLARENSSRSEKS